MTMTSANTKPNTKRGFVLASIALVSLLLLPLASTRGEAAAALNEAQKTERALQFITRNGTAMAAIMANDSMPKREKRLKLKAIVEEHFDLTTMMRAIVGPYWRKMNEPQRERYQKASMQWVVLYSANILSTFNLSKFDVLSARLLGKDVLVETQTQAARSSDSLTMHWRVRFRSDDSPALIDMHFRGLSMIGAQRSEVTAVLTEQGIPIFLDRLDERLEKIKREFDKN